MFPVKPVTGIVPEPAWESVPVTPPPHLRAVRLGVGLDDDAIHQRLLILAEGEDYFLRELALEPGGCAAFRGIDQPGDVRLPGGEPHDGRAVGGAENV